MFCVYEALKRGIDHKVIYDITKIDWWFLDKMQHLADLTPICWRRSSTLAPAAWPV